MTAAYVPPESLREHAGSIFLSPGEMPHATQSEASMIVWRSRVGEPLHSDDTTPLHHALMGEEHDHGEYPHP